MEIALKLSVECTRNTNTAGFLTQKGTEVDGNVVSFASHNTPLSWYKQSIIYSKIIWGAGPPARHQK